MAAGSGYILRRGDFKWKHTPKMCMTGRLQEASGVTSGVSTDAGTADSKDLAPCSVDAKVKNICVYLLNK